MPAAPHSRFTDALRTIAVQGVDTPRGPSTRNRRRASLGHAEPHARFAWTEAGVDVYTYFNNDHEGHALTDARWLRNELADRP